jgi:selenocysteine-specific elongation factor
VRGLPHPLTARGAFTFHAGAAERAASLRVYGSGSVPVDGAFARLRLSAPVVLDVGDRFVLRESGRRETVAGGVVMDAAPPRRSGARVVERLEARLGAPRDRLPELLLAERGAVRVEEVRPLTGAEAVEGADRVGRWWLAPGVGEGAERDVESHLRAFHAEHPAQEGAEAAQVRSWAMEALREAEAPAAPDLAEDLVERMLDRGSLVRAGRSIRLPTHAVGVEDAEVDRLVSTVAGAGPTPPTIAELRASGVARETIDAGLRAGALVRIAPDLVVTASFVARAVEAVSAAGSAGITVSALRQALGTSRKYAVPLLEHLDRTGVTRRSGDLRFARGS